jgi:hypothetical protein
VNEHQGDGKSVKKGQKGGECAWCSGKFLPSTCLGVNKAKYIPEQVGCLLNCMCVELRSTILLMTNTSIIWIINIVIKKSIKIGSFKSVLTG